jgi:protein TonB
MLTSKFDLYKTEWLDLVFDDRNKTYGAYELRRTYAPTMVKAMGITFLSLAVLCGGYAIANSGKEILHHTTVVLDPDVPVVIPPEAVKPPQPPKQERPEKVLPPVKTVQFITMVPKPEQEAVDPPKMIDLRSAIGPVNSKGDSTINNTPPQRTAPKGTPGDGPAVSNEPITNFSSLEVMPLPDGGMEAWAKFLNKNLRFPYEAQQDNVSGRVFLSFIIEKDGHLSDITVIRAAGHGFDEEALRVLKLAKAWKPGVQNGQPVRVKYSIPINFQQPE